MIAKTKIKKNEIMDIFFKFIKIYLKNVVLKYELSITKLLK